jgi:hypothetical protein
MAPSVASHVSRKLVAGVSLQGRRYDYHGQVAPS